MRDRGWLGGSIVADTDGLVADGEHRLKAASEIGLEEVPVKFYDFTDAERRLARQELNKISGEHDRKRDALEYDQLLDAGKSDEVDALVNAADEDLDELLAEIRVDKSSTPFYEYDVEHSVYFEDCVEGMAERLDDDSVDCVITDPPYGIDWQSGHREEEFDKLAADENIDDAIELFDVACAEFQRVLKPNSHIYICTRWDVYSDFQHVVRRHFTERNCLVWAKNNWGMGSLDTGYRPQHEFVIFAHADSPRTLNGQHSDLLEYPRAPTTEYTHPTEKPLGLVEELLVASSDKGDTVLDPFMGSGTTAVAAIQNDRDYVGFEIDEENYRSVIERRIGEAKRQMESPQNNLSDAGSETADAESDD
jgi:DNA modification methylase